MSDAIVMGGVAWYLASVHEGHLVLLPLAVLAASSLISYERAKAEALGISAKGGLMERAERMILLGVGFLTPWLLVPILWLLLGLTMLTAVGRFVRVWSVAEGPARPPAGAHRHAPPIGPGSRDTWSLGGGPGGRVSRQVPGSGGAAASRWAAGGPGGRRRWPVAAVGPRRARGTQRVFRSGPPSGPAMRDQRSRDPEAPARKPPLCPSLGLVSGISRATPPTAASARPWPGLRRALAAP